MKTVIEPGDRVQVTRIVRGHNRGTYKATVLRWTGNGQLTVKPDDIKEGGTKNVSADNVKKISK